MHTMTATHHIPHRTSIAANPIGWLRKAILTHRQRLELETLDAHMLEDIGINRDIARAEARRPFWDLPR